MKKNYYLLTFAKLDRALSKVPPIESFSTLSVKEHTNETRNSSNPVKIKLPELVIKKFSGNILEWQSFWDQLSSEIHQKDYISDIDTFNYLNSFFCDSVSATIRSLSLTSENYHQAIEMLEERYANQQILISAHMQKFVSLPSVKNQHDAAGLRKLFDQVESSVRNLKSLKVETNSYGSLLVPLLNEELPNDMRERIARKFDNNVWSLDDMLNFLKRELEAKERSLSVGATFSDKRKQSFDNEVFSSSALLNQGLNSNIVTMCLISLS